MMLKYILKRLLQCLLTLIIVVTLVFVLLRFMPEEGYFKPREYRKLTVEQKEMRLKEMGLKEPLYIQLFHFFENIFNGDFGVSYRLRKNVQVERVLLPKIPYSVGFGLASVLISILLGVPLGILMAGHKGKLADSLGNAYIIFIKAVPAAVYYLFLQIVATDLFSIPMLFNKNIPSTYIMPTISMALGGIAFYAMWTRRYMVDELNKDYIKLARAKGMPWNDIMRKHVIRNAFVPLAQYLPANILWTISGSIYVESLYSIPGMGGLLVEAINAQDNAIIQILVLIYSSIGIIGLLLGDILMVIFDPRIKLDKSGGGR